MDVLYCITRSDTIGGAQIHVADMSSWLIEQGHSASVIVGGEGIFCKELARRSIPYRSCPSLQRAISLRHDIRAIGELRSIFKDQSPDLISLHSAKAGVLGRLATIGLLSPVVFTAHGWSFTEGVPKRKAFVYRALEKSLARLADRIITVSEYDRALALRLGVGQADKIIVIHNAMRDVDVRARAGESSCVPRILMVARLNEQKDHATLFNALSRMADSFWELDLVGDGPLESMLRNLSAKLGIDERVHFLGLRDDVANIMAKAHLFVLSSHWEGFPRSILEAMRAGLPVIASDVGGVDESVQHGETGYVVDAKDADTLKSRIEYLLEQPAERARMGSNARARFEKEFLFQRMACETFEVYTSVLNAANKAL